MTPSCIASYDGTTHIPAILHCQLHGNLFVRLVTHNLKVLEGEAVNVPFLWVDFKHLQEQKAP